MMNRAVSPTVIRLKCTWAVQHHRIHRTELIVLVRPPQAKLGQCFQSVSLNSTWFVIQIVPEERIRHWVRIGHGQSGRYFVLFDRFQIGCGCFVDVTIGQRNKCTNCKQPQHNVTNGNYSKLDKHENEAKPVAIFGLVNEFDWVDRSNDSWTNANHRYFWKFFNAGHQTKKSVFDV